MFVFLSCEGRWYILTPLYYMSVHPLYTHWLLLGVRVNIETCHNSKKQTCCSAVWMPLATRDALSDLIKVGRGFSQLTPPLSWHSQLLVQHSYFNTNRLSSSEVGSVIPSPATRSSVIPSPATRWNVYATKTKVSHLFQSSVASPWRKCTHAWANRGLANNDDGESHSWVSAK